ncbi:MAG: agmatinase [Desulfurococcales archaeon]|nr:agmatinase [Desulfurococcales archaeon]
MKSLFIAESPEAFGGYRPEKKKTPYSLIGFPFDSTSSFRAGQRFGPNAVRTASRYIEFNSLRAGVDVDEIGGVFDEGDVAIVHGDPRETVRRVEEIYKEIFASENSRIPILIGGEHLGSLGALSAFRIINPCLIWIDAHMDLREDYLGCKYSHASVVRRLNEKYGGNIRLFYIGVRGFSEEEHDYAENKGYDIVTSLEAFRIGEDMLALKLKKFLAGCNHYYISIDMDAFDPSYAPAVGNPEPEGLTPSLILDVLWKIIDNRLVGFDIMETSPVYDLSGITGILASKLVVELVAMHYAKSGREK